MGRGNSTRVNVLESTIWGARKSKVKFWRRQFAVPSRATIPLGWRPRLVASGSSNHLDDEFYRSLERRQAASNLPIAVGIFSPWNFHRHLCSLPLLPPLLASRLNVGENGITLEHVDRRRFVRGWRVVVGNTVKSQQSFDPFIDISFIRISRW